MGADELHYSSLDELAQRLARRELSPVGATRAQLERIDELDPRTTSTGRGTSYSATTQGS